jgi:hypothetical protein
MHKPIVKHMVYFQNISFICYEATYGPYELCKYVLGYTSQVFMKALEENSYFMILKIMESSIQNSYFMILENMEKIIFRKFLFLDFENYG